MHNAPWPPRVPHESLSGHTTGVPNSPTQADDWLFPLSGPAPTVVCHGDVRWWWKDGDGKSQCAKMSVQETALLQTFPNNYEWPKDVKLARQLVGNAVPPRVARLLLEAEA